MGPPLPPPPASSSSSSSFVSRAKTALHTAASKAEKVINDIKSDLKTDRHHNRDGEKRSQKELKDEKKNVAGDPDKSQLECHKPKHSRWKITNHGKIKHQKQSHVRIGQRDKAIVVENGNDLTPQYQDKDLLQKEKQSSAPERSHIEKDDDSIVYNVVASPSASVIKQLAMILDWDSSEMVNLPKSFCDLQELAANWEGL